MNMYVRFLADKIRSPIVAINIFPFIFDAIVKHAHAVIGVILGRFSGAPG